MVLPAVPDHSVKRCTDEQAAAPLWRALDPQPEKRSKTGRDVGLAKSGARPYRVHRSIT
jgi:hypothetical protein